MPTQNFRSFLTGPAAWQPRSPWHPILAVLAAIAIVVVGQIAPIAVLTAMTGAPPQPLSDDPDTAGTLHDFMEHGGASLLIAGQATLALLTILAAGRFGGRFSEVLALDQPEGGTRTYVYAILLMIPAVALINAGAYAASPEGFVSDFEQFRKLAGTSQPIAAFLAIAVGAPLWEELLFRGFLLGPLARPLGFWPAAILVSGTWTVMHIGYSMAGLLEVFLIGLYFSWLLRRAGSLWPPILCHAAYNGALFILIRFWTA
jgi:membrane protease YdiL (CAAX protease family)